MARSRNIKPSFFKNDVLVELPFEARLLFIGLWTLADREGRLEDRPKKIKMELFPADSVDVDGILSLLDGEFILRYDVNGEKYIQINNFSKHQNPHHKEPASLIPAPDQPESDPADSLLLIPDSPSLNPDSGGSAEPQGDSAPAVATIPTNTGEEYPITAEQVSEWETTYPAVDVKQQLAEIRAWSNANKAKRKTAGGMLRFVNSWLSREQDKGGSKNLPNSGPPSPSKFWGESWPGIVERGAQLELTQGKDEPFPDFKLRVFKAAKNSGEQICWKENQIRPYAPDD